MPRAPRRARIVSRRRRGARRRRPSRGSRMSDRATRRRIHRAPAGGDRRRASASRRRPAPAYPPLGMGRAARPRYPEGSECRARVSPARRGPAVLRQVSAEHLEGFLGAVAEAGGGAGLPQFVGREVRESCGAGCSRPGWRGFGAGLRRERLVPFRVRAGLVSELRGQADDGADGASRRCGPAVGPGATMGPDGAVSAGSQMASNHGLRRAVLARLTRALGEPSRAAPARTALKVGEPAWSQRCRRGLGVKHECPLSHARAGRGLTEAPGARWRLIRRRGRATPRWRRRSPRSATRCSGSSAPRPGARRRREGAGGSASGGVPSAGGVGGRLGAGAGGAGLARGGRVRRLGDARDAEAMTSRGPRHAHLEGFDRTANVGVGE